MFSLAQFASALSLLAIAHALTKLSDGNGMEYGSSGLASGLKQWQSSGILYSGCSLSTSIHTCYQISLSSNPNSQLDDHFLSSPRQRIEFRTVPYGSGSRYSFTWKQYIATNVTTVPSNSRFFHLMQIFDQNTDYPVFTLDAVSNELKLGDIIGDKCGGDCPSVSFSSYHGRTTLHSMQITFGSNGKLDYLIKDADSGDEIMEYHTTGKFGTSATYIKYGTYRTAYSGMSAITAAVGDFSQKQL